MIKRPIALLAAAAIAASACGGSPAATSVTVTATIPTSSTVAPTSTTSAPSTTVAVTSTTAVISRDARLAVARCSESMGQLFASMVLLDAPGTSSLDEAQAACKEAALQIDADDPPVGSRESKLALAVSEINLALSVAAVDVQFDNFHDDRVTRLQASVDDFDRSVDLLT